MDALAVQLDCARVGLVDQAQSRGVVDQSSAPSAAAWLMEHSVHLEPAEASRTAKLSQLCSLPKNQVMSAAVAGTVTVRKAMTALGQLAAVEHDLAPGGREQALGWLTQMAQTGHNNHVIAVGRRLMALLGADRALERDEDKLRTLNSLRLSPLENGMTRISGCLDPEAAAVLTAALDPLSAPPPLRARTADATPAPPTGAAPKPSSRSAAARPPPEATPGHQQSPGRGPDRLRHPGRRRPRRRDHPHRAGPLTPDHPQVRLRRVDHPHRPRQRKPAPGHRAHQTTGHPSAARSPVGPGQTLHLPPLRATPELVRQPSRPPLDQRRTHRPDQSGVALCRPPHIRPPTRPHRHRHRRHLAHLTPPVPDRRGGCLMVRSFGATVFQPVNSHALRWVRDSGQPAVDQAPHPADRARPRDGTCAEGATGPPG